MKNKKGFTLIELLAVIVVLALILLISVPKILRVIEESEKEAFRLTGEHLVKGARDKYLMDSMVNVSSKIYTIEDGAFVEDTISMNGKLPDNGTIKVREDGKILLKANNDKYCIIKDYLDSRVTINTDVITYIVEEDLGNGEIITKEVTVCNPSQFIEYRSRSCETYTSCVHSSCGAASCPNDSCSCKTYNSCATSGCGCETYNSCPNASACGYLSCPNSSCDCICRSFASWYLRKTYVSKTNQTYLKSAAERNCDSWYRSCSKVVGDSYYCISSVGTTTCYDCKEYARNVTGCATYASCVHSSCGAASCPNSSCSCKTWKTCANSACGCKTYNSCENASACGYLSCATPDCGCELWASYSDWSKDECVPIENEKECESRTTYN